MGYCIKCGMELHEDAKFCHACGTSIVLKIKEKENDVSSALNSKPSQAFNMVHKPKTKVIAICVAIIAAILALVLAFVLIFGNSLPDNKVNYGSNEAVAVLGSTRIIMFNDDNKPMSDYYVTAVDSNGGLTTFHVNEGNFTPESIGLPSSTYKFVVENSSDKQQISRVTPPIIVIDSNSSESSSSNIAHSVSASDIPNEIGIIPPENTSASSLENSPAGLMSADISMLYYAKIIEYQNRYGKGEVSQSSSLDYLSGLWLVKLIDFNNDGQDELLLGYLAKENTSDKNVILRTDYAVDIFGVVDGKLVSLIHTGVMEIPGPNKKAVLVNIDGTEYIASCKYDQDYIDMSCISKDYQGINKVLRVDDVLAASEYLIDEPPAGGTFGDKKLSHDEITTILKAIDSSKSSYNLYFSVSNMNDAKAEITISNNVIEKILKASLAGFDSVSNTTTSSMKTVVQTPAIDEIKRLLHLVLDTYSGAQIDKSSAKTLWVNSYDGYGEYLAHRVTNYNTKQDVINTLNASLSGEALENAMTSSDLTRFIDTDEGLYVIDSVRSAYYYFQFDTVKILNQSDEEITVSIDSKYSADAPTVFLLQSDGIKYKVNKMLSK